MKSNRRAECSPVGVNKCQNAIYRKPRVSTPNYEHAISTVHGDDVSQPLPVAPHNCRFGIAGPCKLPIARWRMHQSRYTQKLLKFDVGLEFPFGAGAVG
jgi:hypothetical protein